MALTREYKKTVVARLQRDKQFARALYAEAMNALLDGETEEGLSMLRDLVHAGISFKELAEQTGLGEKALHRMLSPRGNPTTRNLFAVTKAICEHLSFKPRIAVEAHS
ncbi:MAG: DNA-binding protein [Limisphaerales bacterium]|jgi:DNA-binding phage protein